jgi:hypothetical protein
MPKIARTFETKTASTKGILDLEKLSDEELATLIFQVPQAIQEIVYRELNQQTDSTNTNI